MTLDLPSEARRLAMFEHPTCTHFPRPEFSQEILAFAEKVRQEALAEDVCRCGHLQIAHDGHTYQVGSEPPDHCSQGDGCRHFISRRGFAEGRIAGLEEAAPALRAMLEFVEDPGVQSAFTVAALHGCTGTEEGRKANQQRIEMARQALRSLLSPRISALREGKE